MIYSTVCRTEIGGFLQLWLSGLRPPFGHCLILICNITKQMRPAVWFDA